MDKCQPIVIEVFNRAVTKLKQDERVEISYISLPEHTTAAELLTPLFRRGSFAGMIKGCGYGVGVSGNFNVSIYFEFLS